jgi:hypothetical protein
MPLAVTPANLAARFSLAAVLLGSMAAPVRAVDVFEIQVYQGDIDDRGQAGLELHTNFVASGRRTADFPGEAVPDGSLHLTLEPSLGLLPWWEVGAYLQLATAPSRSQAHFGGFKLRTKFMVPRPASGEMILGLNIEVGRGVAALGSDSWDSEVRPIIARGFGRLFVAVNPILGWSFSGEEAGPAPAFEPCAKVVLDTRRGFGVGLEYYAGLGKITALLPPAEQQHVVYLAADLLDRSFEVNLALGRGLTPATDAWTIKAILGKAF